MLTEPTVSTGNRLQEAEDEPQEGDQRLRISNRDDFSEIFRRFYAPLVRYARGITGDVALAEDVVQEVFTKLWKDRMQITVEVSLNALLYTMTRNRALNVNRRKQKIASDIRPEDVNERRGDEPSAEERLGVENLRRQLYDWIEDLAPRRKEAFMLSRYHGLAHSEIATIMGLSKRTVDTHILLALRELRGRLDELTDEDPLP